MKMYLRKNFPTKASKVSFIGNGCDQINGTILKTDGISYGWVFSQAQKLLSRCLYIALNFNLRIQPLG